jgi:hypothetical protein
MSPRRPYSKPFVASKKVFSLTSQPCDVDSDVPGPCADFMMWDVPLVCSFQMKSPDDVICVVPPIKPIFKS